MQLRSKHFQSADIWICKFQVTRDVTERESIASRLEKRPIAAIVNFREDNFQGSRDSPQVLPLSHEPVHLIIAGVREHHSAKRFEHLPRLP